MRIPIFLLGSAGVLLIGFWLPWWGFLLPALIVGLLSRGGREAALAGFLSVFTVMFLMCAFRDFQSGFLVGGRIAGVFMMGFSIVAMFATGLVTGLTASSASLAGHYLGRILFSRKSIAQASDANPN